MSVTDNLLDELTKLLDAQPVDVKRCQDKLLQLKLQLVTFQLVPPFTEHETTVKKNLLTARTTLELGASLAIESKELDAFFRHIAQLKPYYADFTQLLPPSEKQWPLTGAYLLGLLCQNRIAEFHAELELIPIERREDPCISFPLELEQSLMEGSYQKVLNAAVPRPQFHVFFSILSSTVRVRIAECCAKAYTSVSIAEAGELLMLHDKATLPLLASQHSWTLEGNELRFPQDKDTSLDIPSARMIEQTLSYALELERIV